MQGASARLCPRLRREKGAHLVSPGRRSRVERRSRARLERGIFKPQHFASVAETGIAELRCYRLQTTGPTIYVLLVRPRTRPAASRRRAFLRHQRNTPVRPLPPGKSQPQARPVIQGSP
jgi:hypothetical protein